MPAITPVETESGGQKHLRLQIRRFRTLRVRATSIDQSANLSIGLRLWRGARVYNQCESGFRANAILLRSRVVARGNFRRDRFAGTEGIPPAKWPSSSRVAHLEWTLRPPDQDGLVHDSGQGAQSLLEHVWENC